MIPIISRHVSKCNLNLNLPPVASAAASLSSEFLEHGVHRRGPCCSRRSTRPVPGSDSGLHSWVLVKGFNISYHDKETRLCTVTIDPYYGNLT